eukprot:29312-Pelagococcus_subviridis.AAC.9
MARGLSREQSKEKNQKKSQGQNKGNTEGLTPQQRAERCAPLARVLYARRRVPSRRRRDLSLGWIAHSVFSRSISVRPQRRRRDGREEGGEGRAESRAGGVQRRRRRRGRRGGSAQGEAAPSGEGSVAVQQQPAARESREEGREVRCN